MIGDLVRTEFERHKLRTILTVVGIVIGIFLLVTLASFTAGMQASINEDLSVLSGLVTVVSNDVTFANYQASQIDEDYSEELLDVSGVEDTAPVIFIQVAKVGSIIGFEPDDLDFFPADYVGYQKGRLFEEGSREIALGSKAAERLGYTIGDIIEIRTNNYEVVGVFEETGTTDDEAIITSIENAKEMWGKDDKITLVMLKPEDVEEVDLIAERINDDYEDDLYALSQKDAQRRAEDLVGQINIMVYSVGLIAAIIAGIVIMNVMFMSVRERRQQIGVMKAVGATDTQVLSEILAESAIIAIVGGVFGLILAFLASVGINAYLGESLTKITLPLIAGSIGFSLFLGIVGGILPARTAAKINPIEALRYE